MLKNILLLTLKLLKIAMLSIDLLISMAPSTAHNKRSASTLDSNVLLDFVKSNAFSNHSKLRSKKILVSNLTSSGNPSEHNKKPRLYYRGAPVCCHRV